MPTRCCWILTLVCAAIPSAVSVRACPTKLTTERVASGLARPVFVTAPPGDTQRLFIVEQFVGSDGRIRILDLETLKLKSAPFLTVKNVSNGNEQGLLGLAFHPDYANNGLFYVDFTNASGHTVIREYQVSANNPDVADPNSARQLLLIQQPFSNHNGGWIGFGPDGYLYIAMGDGGDANDPGNRAQNKNILLGKLLRIDVNGDDFPDDPNRNYAIPPNNPFVDKDGADEIWAYGLRNPWRDSFDRLTGELWIADVGQGQREEIDFQPAGSTGGENYGWRCKEGTRCTGLSGCDCKDATLVDPIYEYTHDNGNCAITGGYVYRGKRIPDLRGTYFFADYCSNKLWSFRYNGTVIDFTDRTTELDPAGSLKINSVTSFGEDAAGELYIVDGGGEVFRVIPNGPVVGDLNVDGKIDFDDIDAFTLALTDKEQYRTQYGQDPDQIGDINCSGAIDFDDIDPFVQLLILEG